MVSSSSVRKHIVGVPACFDCIAIQVRGQDPIWVSESLPQRPLIGRFKGYTAVVVETDSEKTGGRESDATDRRSPLPAATILRRLPSDMRCA